MAREAAQAGGCSNSASRRAARRAAAEAAEQAVRRFSAKADFYKGLFEDLLSVLDDGGGGELGLRLAAAAPALHDLMLGRRPGPIARLRRNCAMHAAAIGLHLPSATPSALRRAQRGPRLGAALRPGAAEGCGGEVCLRGGAAPPGPTCAPCGRPLPSGAVPLQAVELEIGLSQAAGASRREALACAQRPVLPQPWVVLPPLRHHFVVIGAGGSGRGSVPWLGCAGAAAQAGAPDFGEAPNDTAREGDGCHTATRTTQTEEFAEHVEQKQENKQKHEASTKTYLDYLQAGDTLSSEELHWCHWQLRGLPGAESRGWRLVKGAR
eukprot:4439764-Lingulodinium_polyedra.AAC.1